MNYELLENSTVAAVQSCFCFIIVAAAIVLGIGALFLLFVLLYSQRVASQSCETLGELLHHPWKIENTPFYSCLLGDLAFEWQRGCRIPCFDADLTAFVQIKYSVFPPCQNKPKCETVILVKMSTVYRFIFLQIKLIFIRKVLHVDSF